MTLTIGCTIPEDLPPTPLSSPSLPRRQYCMRSEGAERARCSCTHMLPLLAGRLTAALGMLHATSGGAATAPLITPWGLTWLGDLPQIHWPDRYVPLFGAASYDIHQVCSNFPWRRGATALGQPVRPCIVNGSVAPSQRRRCGGVPGAGCPWQTRRSERVCRGVGVPALLPGNRIHSVRPDPQVRSDSTPFEEQLRGLENVIKAGKVRRREGGGGSKGALLFAPINGHLQWRPPSVDGKHRIDSNPAGCRAHCSLQGGPFPLS